ncbi:MAG: PsiF family protein, partial [Gammaproteobacteria bacterium]
MHVSIAIGILLVGSQGAFAATAQQEKMKSCNTDAATQQLKGPARQGFMKSCLSAKKSELTPQQQKMSTC